MAKVKILNSCAGNGISFYAGQIVEITKKNTDVVYSKIRHGTAVMIEEEEKKKKVDEGRGQNEDTNILHDTPIRRTRIRRIDKTEGS